MVVFVISGASDGLGPELVRQASHNSQNIVFALVKSVKAAERLADLSSTRDNVHVYFENQDCQAGYEVIARDISKYVSCVDIILNNVAWVEDYLGMRTLHRADRQANQMDRLQQFFSDRVLDTIRITNAFIPLLYRGSLRKVLTIAPERAFSHHSTWLPGFDNDVACAMVKVALDMATLRYMSIPEFKQRKFTYVTIEFGHADILLREELEDDYCEQVRGLVQEIFGMTERVGFEDSVRCVGLREPDLIIL